MRVNGLTLGSYWGYFRNRSKPMNMDYAYADYCSHIVIGVLYKQTETNGTYAKYKLDDLDSIKSVVEDFIFFVQPKWKIASDSPGSGNTRNIGGEHDISKLIGGKGVFAELGEDIFDDYWMNYFNATDARNAGIGLPKFNNIESYKKYLRRQNKFLNRFAE